MKRLLIIGLLLWSSFTLMAQDNLAAQLEVLSTGVEVQRADTASWLPLRLSAIAPIGAGDKIRTGDSGRFRLRLGESAEVIVLPRSTLTLVNYQINANQPTIALELAGVMVQSSTDSVVYHLQTSDFTVTQAAPLMAVWSEPLGPDTLTVAEGVARVTLNLTGEVWDVAESQGYRAGAFEVVTLEAPLSAARVQAQLRSCAGTVQAALPEYLTIYDGAGTGWDVKGVIANGSTVQIVGLSFTNYWTRIQYGSGYGWIVTDALQYARCTGMALFPDDAPEPFYPRVWGVQASEILLLRPFFGLPLVDRWFYGN